jgi:hypothetical protein
MITSLITILRSRTESLNKPIVVSHILLWRRERTVKIDSDNKKFASALSLQICERSLIAKVSVAEEHVSISEVDDGLIVSRYFAKNLPAPLFGTRVDRFKNIKR